MRLASALEDGVLMGMRRAVGGLPLLLQAQELHRRTPKFPPSCVWLAGLGMVHDSSVMASDVRVVFEMKV